MQPYALKDTVGGIVAVLLFGGSLLRPLLGAFAAQALDPRTPEQEASLERLLAERSVARTLLISTAGLTLLNAATAPISSRMSTMDSALWAWESTVAPTRSIVTPLMTNTSLRRLTEAPSVPGQDRLTVAQS